MLPQSKQEPTPAVGRSLQGGRKTSKIGCSKECKGSLTIICQNWQVSGTEQRAHTNGSIHVCSGGQRPKERPRDARRRAPWLPCPGPRADAASPKRSPAAPVATSRMALGCDSRCNCRKQPAFTDNCPATAQCQCLCLLPPWKVARAEVDRSSENFVRHYRDKTQIEYTSLHPGFAG